MTKVFQRHIALPTDHGSWVFLLSPLLIGLFAGRSWRLAELYLVIAALAAFLIRQPITIAVKSYSGRRSKRDLAPARFWITIYGLIGLSALSGLLLKGYSYLLLLALPGIPVFIGHLYLVSQRAERRQVGIELVASGVLALSAPAAFWVGVGKPDVTGWWLFVLVWLQSAASIMHAYVRLEQRELKSTPALMVRIRIARRALLYTGFNFLFSLAGAIAGYFPPLIPLPYALQLAETMYGTLFPAISVKPTRIGLRQLLISALFTLLFIVAWIGRE